MSWGRGRHRAGLERRAASAGDQALRRRLGFRRPIVRAGGLAGRAVRGVGRRRRRRRRMGRAHRRARARPVAGCRRSRRRGVHACRRSPGHGPRRHDGDRACGGLGHGDLEGGRASHAVDRDRGGRSIARGPGGDDRRRRRHGSGVDARGERVAGAARSRSAQRRAAVRRRQAARDGHRGQDGCAVVGGGRQAAARSARAWRAGELRRSPRPSCPAFASIASGS